MITIWQKQNYIYSDHYGAEADELGRARIDIRLPWTSSSAYRFVNNVIPEQFLGVCPKTQKPAFVCKNKHLGCDYCMVPKDGIHHRSARKAFSTSLNRHMQKCDFDPEAESPRKSKKNKKKSRTARLLDKASEQKTVSSE